MRGAFVRAPQWAACILMAGGLWLVAGLGRAQDSPATSGGTGITGRVVDATNGQGMIEAQIQVVGKGKKVVTDVEGNFTLDLPPGRYTLRSFYEFYKPGRVEGVVVERGERTDVTIELEPESEEAVTTEVVVTARADTSTEATQLQLRRESASVRDAVSAEEIKKSGDSTASAAAKRVVAATIEDDKFLVVRGLGGRWSGVLLNGVPVPNLDPDLPSVELDIFPAALLSSIAILKTFTPDMEASFAGGLMDISTEDFPSEFKLEVGLHLGYETQSTFRHVLTYDGGSTDWLGIDDGTRALPSAVPSTFLDWKKTGSPYSRDQVQAIARNFQDDWQPHYHVAIPNIGVNATVGDTTELFGRKLGYLLSFNYKLEQKRKTGTYRTYRPAKGDQPAKFNDEYDVENVTQSALWGLLGTASYKISDDDEIALVAMWNQSGRKETDFQTGSTNISDRGAIAGWDLDYVQRSLFIGQLIGKHLELAIPPHSELRWMLFTSYGSRKEPDRRTIRYFNQLTTAKFDFNYDSGFYFYDRDYSGEHFFSDVTHFNVGGKANLKFPIGPVHGTVGGEIYTTKRDYGARRFRLRLLPSAALDNKELPPNELFQDDNLGTVVTLEEATQDTDGYESQQDMYAAFGMLEMPVYDNKLRITAGVRAEGFRQTIDVVPAVRFYQPLEPQGTRRTEVNILPAAGLVWEMAKGVFLRASYGQTVVRPDAPELAPTSHFDFVRNRNVTGNPDLQPTTIKNYDLRWEWFPSATEVLAVSGFYKEFQDPIEIVIQNGETRDASYGNVDGAKAYGLELEAKVNLSHLTDALRWFTVGGNLALLKTQIVLSGEQADQESEPKRPLAGASPYVVNLSLGFDHPDSGVSVNLFYNVFGRRLAEVGVKKSNDSYPGIYEEPFHALDLTAKWAATDHWSLSFSAKNLVGDQHVLKQGDVTVESWDPGRGFSIGAAWKH